MWMFQLGLEDIFTSQAQLQGISDERLRVSEVVQKAEIEVNEQGATASAGTGNSKCACNLHSDSFNFN
jgi:serine protease inhibitor